MLELVQIKYLYSTFEPVQNGLIASAGRFTQTADF